MIYFMKSLTFIALLSHTVCAMREGEENRPDHGRGGGLRRRNTNPAPEGQSAAPQRRYPHGYRGQPVPQGEYAYNRKHTADELRNFTDQQLETHLREYFRSSISPGTPRAQILNQMMTDLKYTIKTRPELEALDGDSLFWYGDLNAVFSPDEKRHLRSIRRTPRGMEKVMTCILEAGMFRD